MADPSPTSREEDPNPNRSSIDVWVGTSLGIVKGICLSSKQVTNYLPSSLSLSQTDQTKEVCAMCWDYQSKESFYCGLRSGIVQQFSCRDRVFRAECDCTGGDGVFVGLGKHEEVLITCANEGRLSYWPPDNDKTERNVGGNVWCMAASPHTLLQIATGGKENELKVWDGNKLANPIFQAKNVKNDQLDLRVPVWVRSVGYIPDSGNQPTIAVGTGYHQVRLYDTKAQRRPVYCQEFGEHPVTALTVHEDGRSYFAGNSAGEVARFDMRTGSVLNQYKGFAGGVNCIQCYSDGTQSLMAATGLDRYLRVYSLQPAKLLNQVYLKLQSNCLLFSNESSNHKADSDKSIKTLASRKRVSKEAFSGSEESSEDEVWKEMDTVHEKKVSRSNGQRSAKLKPTSSKRLRSKNQMY